MMVTGVYTITHPLDTQELTTRRITLINIPTLQQLAPFMDALNISMQGGPTVMLMWVMVIQGTHILTQTVMI
jgi:hypothetical protein